MLLKTLPKRETDNEIPNASATSPPSNHFASRADCATHKLSPPKPNMVRPKNTTAQLLALIPIDVINCPTKDRVTKPNTHGAEPIVSTKYPPKNGRTMLGSE